MNKHGKFYNGILLLNKPSGITSHDAVAEVRKTIRQRRVGHTGTLDPRAEGLIVVCMGRGTKIARFLTDYEKVYEAEVCLGKKSRTFDSEGIFEDQMPMDAPEMSHEEMQEVLNQYLGEIDQQVPAYSAVRVDGERLYNLARRGVDVEPPVRKVHIKELELISYERPYIRFRMKCSKGTYVRSLANDIGNDLGCGAYLSELRRHSVGKLSLDKALTLGEVDRYHANGTLEKHLLGYEKVLSFASVKVTDDFKKQIISGRDLQPKDIVKIDGSFDIGDTIMLKDSQGKVMAVGTAESEFEAFTDKTNSVKLFSYVRVLN